MLDSRYILMQDLQEYFVDKDTGLPLSAGRITFYSDINRTVLKNIYQLTGSPPNYTYAPLPNPLILSAVGTPQDASGNDVAVYYFPFDINGNVELYYITAESAGLVSQFTREAWPNLEETSASAEDVKNYVENGQFLIHTNIPETSTSSAGQVTSPITILAQGGWSFERPMGSSATDFVTFSRFASPVNFPSANPRYACRINTTIPNAGDTFKDLRLKFNDVNKFASEDQEYTWSFAGQTNSGTSTVVSIEIVKNYGTGGSAQTITNVGTITIPASYEIFNIPFIFDTNVGKTIGILDDDFLQIVLRFPTNSVFDVSVTDFVLTPGNVVLADFPQTPNSNFLYSSIAGFLDVPDYNSMDLYLPLMLTPTGLTYDDSAIGTVVGTLLDTPPVSWLKLDGPTLKVSDYSSDGIPFKRLFNKLFNDTTLISMFGNGSTFVNAYQVDGDSGRFRLTANTIGTCTNSSDGSIPTGFIFNNVTSGGSYGFFSGVANQSTGEIIIISKNSGSGSGNSGTTGWFFGSSVLGNVSGVNEVALTIATGPAGLAGDFIIINNAGSLFAPWFTVDGSGSAPSPGVPLIRINLFSTYTANDVARIVSETVSGFHIDDVICAVASDMTPGCWFNFFTPSGNHYTPYYIINGVGSNPNVPGAIGIPILLSGSENANQVRTKTISTLNSVFYGLPDWGGLFLRGIGNDGIFDNPDSDIRYSLMNSSIKGDVPGTTQYDQIIGHDHTASTTMTSPPNVIFNGASGLDSNSGSHLGITTTSFSTIVNLRGGAESRPYNASVNWIIKY